MLQAEPLKAPAQILKGQNGSRGLSLYGFIDQGPVVVDPGTGYRGDQGGIVELGCNHGRPCRDGNGGGDTSDTKQIQLAIRQHTIIVHQTASTR